MRERGLDKEEGEKELQRIRDQNKMITEVSVDDEEDKYSIDWRSMNTIDDNWTIIIDIWEYEDRETKYKDIYILVYTNESH